MCGRRYRTLAVVDLDALLDGAEPECEPGRAPWYDRPMMAAVRAAVAAGLDLVLISVQSPSYLYRRTVAAWCRRWIGTTPAALLLRAPGDGRPAAVVQAELFGLLDRGRVAMVIDGRTPREVARVVPAGVNLVTLETAEAVQRRVDSTAWYR